MHELQSQGEPIDPYSLAEFCCWTAVALAPILTWVNGPAVSTDQFVVRTSTFSLALCGAIGLRLRKVISRRRAKASPRDATVPPKHPSS